KKPLWLDSGDARVYPDLVFRAGNQGTGSHQSVRIDRVVHGCAAGLFVRNRSCVGQRNYGLGSRREGSGRRAVSFDSAYRPIHSNTWTISSSTCIFLFVDGAPRRLAWTARSMLTLWTSHESRNCFSFLGVRGALLCGLQ